MDGGGQVVVSTSRSQRSGSDGPGDILIRLEDNGPGLPDTVKDNLFTPFISTKGIGHSGLGLSIVKKAVADLGGTIGCTSEPGDGTVFEIGLPISNE
jgi:signal transduction histidine kinase